MNLRLLYTGILVSTFASGAAMGDHVAFDRQILPILSSKCFQCHGPDEAARKAGLRLDKAESATADHDGVTAVVPGKPEASELIRRVTATDLNDRMPPPESGEALTAEEVALLETWIKDGAAWSTHWAFVAPVRPEVPANPLAAAANNAIDNFVYARLAAEGLAPAPQTDKITLLRRLSLDLTGLPPTLEEIADAEADTSDAWYNNAVDRLLASPHYGEHWARDWLDAAQYADSDGFEKDKPRAVWSWRDWVIRAFNDNMPYDQFVVDQVAGDLEPNATQAQRIATGFLRNSMINEEGGIDPEQFRMEAQFNRVDIVGRAVLGLTLQCAQCHTHKYDPITHTEYYRLLSFLNNTNEACMTVLSPEEEKQRKSILGIAGELENEIKTEVSDWSQRVATWEEGARQIAQPQWQTLEFVFDDTSSGGQKCLPLGDGSYLAQGYAPTQFHPKMTSTTTLPKVTAVRVEFLTDPNLPRGGPGRSVYGALALSEFELRFTKDNTSIAEYDKWTLVKLAKAMADVNPPQRKLGPEFPDRQDRNRVTGSIEMAIDGNHETAWTTDIDPIRRNEAHTAIFTLAEPLTIEPGMTLAVRMSQLHGGWNSDDNQNNNIGRFRISVTDADALPDRVLPPAVVAAVQTPADARTSDQSAAIFAAWRESEPKISEYNQRIAALWRALPSGTTQLVLDERAAPRVTHRLDRGDFLSPAEAVDRGVPAFLHALDAPQPTRLDFAHWLVDRQSPTTARAFVNRVWQHYFGVGLVETASDLGTQGSPPSHPHLLDWLAVEFMDSGWDVKRLHRLIVSSATYKQDSAVSQDLLDRDPYNRLLARGARFRVPGESVRDIALAAGGLLNTEIGGPSVYAPAPEYLFQPPASYGPKTWDTAHGPDRYRRALYTFRFRSVPYPALQVFDTPAGDAPCTGRDRSNSPLQALTTLNETLFFECAKGLAQSALADGGEGDEARMAYAFRRCVSRSPETEELNRLMEFLHKQQQRIAAGELAPQAILRSENADAPADLAAWTLAARVLLNLDETIVRQ